MELLFDENKVNQTRQSELDYVKTLLIFFMMCIHLYEDVSCADYSIMPVGILDNILQFVAGPAGAGLFMFCMGLGFVYSKHKTPKDYLKRGLKIFLYGYLLNIGRDVIPALIFGLTNGYGADPEYWEEMIYLTFNIDIFMFAGLALILTSLLRRIDCPLWGLAAVGIIMQIAGVALSNIFDLTDSYWQYFFGLFFYTSEVSCFPLLQWYIYPVIGLIFGKYLRHVKDTDRLYGALLCGSVTFTAAFITSLRAMGFDVRNFYVLAGDGIYRQDFMHVLFAIPLMFIFISIMHFIRKCLYVEKIDNTVKYIGEKLNRFYIVHWIIVGFFANFLWYACNESMIPVWSTIPIALIIYVITYFINKTLDKSEQGK